MTTHFFTQSKHIPIPTGPLSIDVEYKAKSSYPLIKSTSEEGVIGCKIAPPIYSQEQHETWIQLIKKHSLLAYSNQNVCEEYTNGLKKLHISNTSISNLKDVSAHLKKYSGWEVIRVEGLVSPENFFKLLANKVFPCTDFIRHRDEIDYTPAPDTFHDQVGHLPMLTHPRFADFFHLFGVAGTNVRTAEELEWFNRIYWFTVEFGLINSTVNTNNYDPKKARIYGAGLASSCGEIVYSLSSAVKKLPFDLDVIIKTDFNIHHMQNLLFEIPSFDYLEYAFQEWAKKHKFLC